MGSEDDLKFAHADQAAKALGIDTWDIHWRRLQQKPTDPGRWYHVMAVCDEDRIERVIEFAEANIDLAAIATGAATNLGWAGVSSSTRAWISSCKTSDVSLGGEQSLIEAGLKSPVVRNRNMAVAALAGWSRAEWPGGLEESLEQAAGCEPNEDVRERMRKALRGRATVPVTRTDR